jgi:hypothetical protein
LCNAFGVNVYLVIEPRVAPFDKLRADRWALEFNRFAVRRRRES